MTRKLLNVRCCSHRYWMSTTFLLLLFNPSVTFNSLLPHGLQDTRFPCLLSTSWACSNSCPLSRWCYPTIWPSVIPFSSCLQSFPSSRSFQMSQFFPSGSQSTGASASVLPMNIQDWFPLGLSSWISLHPRDNSSVLSFLYSPTHIHIWLLEKP